MSQALQLYVQSTSGVCRAAVLNDGEVCELYRERDANKSVVGNIYRGKVKRVLPDMQAAFIDIGLPQPGFLHRRDLPGRPSEIATHLHQGQSIIVQVTQPPRGQGQGAKGATLSAEIKLASKSLVWIPTATSNDVVFSKRLSANLDQETRQHLVDLLTPTNSQGTLIVRSGASEQVNIIESELALLHTRWRAVQDNHQRAPSLLLPEMPMVAKLVQELSAAKGFEVLWTKESRSAVDAAAYLDLSDLSSQLVTDAKRQSINSKIDAAERQLESSSLDLQNGARITIESTQAMTVIDVDTAAATINRNAHQESNLLAATEIARQLRLRNVGGIIVVDFINVNAQQKQALLQHFKSELDRDRARTTCEANSSLGLFEVTRQRLEFGEPVWNPTAAASCTNDLTDSVATIEDVA